MNDITRGYLIGVVLACLISMLVVENFDSRIQAQKIAVEQCEQNLARNMHCEPVISAKIVEE